LFSRAETLSSQREFIASTRRIPNPAQLGKK
jgi:hypothetical protein